MNFLKHNLREGATEKFELPRLDCFILYGSARTYDDRVLLQNMCYILSTYFDYEYIKK